MTGACVRTSHCCAASTLATALFAANHDYTMRQGLRGLRVEVGGVRSKRRGFIALTSVSHRSVLTVARVRQVLRQSTLSSADFTRPYRDELRPVKGVPDDDIDCVIPLHCTGHVFHVSARGKSGQSHCVRRRNAIRSIHRRPIRSVTAVVALVPNSLLVLGYVMRHNSDSSDHVGTVTARRSTSRSHGGPPIRVSPSIENACVTVRAQRAWRPLALQGSFSPVAAPAHEGEISGFPAVFEHRREPNLVRIEKSPQLVLHWAGECSVLAPAYRRAHPILRMTESYRPTYRRSFSRGLLRLLIDRCERFARNTSDNAQSKRGQIRFRWEMIVEAGLRDKQLLSYVSIAEAVEPARLSELFCDIENAPSRRRRRRPTSLFLCHSIDFTYW